MNVLVTGGAGYIGSHTCVALAQEGHNIIIIDNLSNSKPEAVRRIEKIICKPVKLYTCDLCDYDSTLNVFKENNIDAVIHFAGYKAVGESVADPIKYYENNIMSTINLVKAMNACGVRKIVFSSSATVYGDPEFPQIKEDAKLSPANPYGRTKLFIEEILRDVYNSDNSFSVAILRYFNPIGAHKSGLIGEDPNGIPNNLLPNVTQVAMGKHEVLSVFGNDYPTPDGTCIRDYIHVCDLADGHIKALNSLDKCGVFTYNLGTGKGISVLEIINSFEKTTGVTVNYKIADRRPGDVPEYFADPEKAEKEIGFKTKFGIDDMCIDAWNFQKNNPNGY